MEGIPTWLAVVGIAVPIIISVFALWRSDQKAAASNRIAQEAKELAKLSNELAREANDIARQSFQAEHVPLIHAEHGKAIDFVVDPPLHLLTSTATNQGKIPVIIERVGIASAPPQRFFGLLFTHNSPLHPYLNLPYELLPGHRAVFATELQYVVPMLEANRPMMGDECWVRFTTATNGIFDAPAMNTDKFLRILKEDNLRVRIDRANEEGVTILGGELGVIRAQEDDAATTDESPKTPPG